MDICELNYCVYEYNEDIVNYIKWSNPKLPIFTLNEHVYKPKSQSDTKVKLKHKNLADLKIYQCEEELDQEIDKDNINSLLFKTINVHDNNMYYLKLLRDVTPNLLMFYTCINNILIHDNVLPFIEEIYDYSLDRPYDMTFEQRFFKKTKFSNKLNNSVNYKDNNNVNYKDNNSVNYKVNNSVNNSVNYKDTNNKAFFYTSEYIGRTLHQWIDSTDNLDLQNICNVIDLYLLYFADIGFIHGNLNVSNVRLSKLDKSHVYKYKDKSVRSRYKIVIVNYDSIKLVKGGELYNRIDNVSESLESTQNFANSLDYCTFYLSLCVIISNNVHYRMIYDDIVRSILYPLYKLNKQTSFGLDLILPKDNFKDDFKSNNELLSMDSDFRDISFIDIFIKRFIIETIDLFIKTLAVNTVFYIFSIINTIIQTGINIFHSLFLNIHDKFIKKHI